MFKTETALYYVVNKFNGDENVSLPLLNVLFPKHLSENYSRLMFYPHLQVCFESDHSVVPVATEVQSAL